MKKTSVVFTILLLIGLTLACTQTRQKNEQKPVTRLQIQANLTEVKADLKEIKKEIKEFGVQMDKKYKEILKLLQEINQAV